MHTSESSTITIQKVSCSDTFCHAWRRLRVFALFLFGSSDCLHPFVIARQESDYFGFSFTILICQKVYM